MVPPVHCWPLRSDHISSFMQSSITVVVVSADRIFSEVVASSLSRREGLGQHGRDAVHTTRPVFGGPTPGRLRCLRARHVGRPRRCASCSAAPWLCGFVAPWTTLSTTPLSPASTPHYHRCPCAYTTNHYAYRSSSASSLPKAAGAGVCDGSAGAPPSIPPSGKRKDEPKLPRLCCIVVANIS